MAFESDHVSHEFFEQLRQQQPVDLVPLSGVVQELRMIKDREELEIIRRSIRINERAFEVIRSQLTLDQTEREIAHNLEHQIRNSGASNVRLIQSSPSGLAAHCRTPLPPMLELVNRGFLLLDWGTQLEGYASDLTRMIVTAKIPPKIRRIHEIVLKAQTAAIAKIRPGASFRSADKAARDVIDKRASASTSGMVWDTVSDWRFTNRRLSRLFAMVNFGRIWWSRSSREFICRASAACVSRTMSG